MKKLFSLMLAASGIAAVCLAYGDDGWDDRWPVRDQETVEKTFSLVGDPMRLIVSNFNGYVHVRGVNGTQVHVVAHKTIRAETNSDLSQAKSEVKLDMTEQPGTVDIEYNAPWRCKGGCGNCCDDRRRFYDVRYDIDVDAPRGARPVISGLNGSIQVDQMDGDFDVHTVNGGIEMSAMGGSGDVRTVNGHVVVRFNRNPIRVTTVKSVNGQLEAFFQRGFSADLYFKTVHGPVDANFDVKPIPVSAEHGEKENGMWVYRSKGQSAVRVGNGGPKISFETVNGGIRLYEGQE
jgi:hypothetical protein